jgi:hypothetical protein
VTATRLRADDIERFVVDGFVRVENAFDRDVATRVCARLYDEIRKTHPTFAVESPETWPGPVVRFPGSIADPFASELTSPHLEAAFDQLVGKDRWRRAGLGTFAVRFPHPVDPDDAGWHIDGSYTGPDGTFWATRRFPDFDDLPIAHATGHAGDAYLCHPFLVHAADRHRGSSPRIIAQPPLAPAGGARHLERCASDEAYSPSSAPSASVLVADPVNHPRNRMVD